MKYRITGKMLRSYQLKPVQQVLNGKVRHMLIIAPRRSGKSVKVFYLVNALINQYWLRHKMPINATIFAPKQNQCREIYVDNILDNGQKLPTITNGKYLKSLLSIEYSFGSKIKFSGSDMIDNNIGAGNKIVVLDEYALSKADAFQRLWPMVQNTHGHMIVVSTPRGKNHLYELYQQVKDNPEWLVIHTDVFKLGLMTRDEYAGLPMHENFKAQEFLCSWDSPFENAIYLPPQVGNYAYEEGYRVYAGIDIGVRDAMAIVFAQYIDGKVIIINSFEANNVGLVDFVPLIKKYLERVGCSLENFKLFVPHDVKQRDAVYANSRLDYLEQCFHYRNIEQVEFTGLMDGIDRVRKAWHLIYFDERGNDGQRQVIERIKAYVTDGLGMLPKHNECSHMADALRYLATGLISPKGEFKIENYESYYHVR